MAKGMHPTKDRLIAGVCDLLDTHSPEQISVALVLTNTGVSSGSLYHFFDDLGDLVEQALLRRFSGGVEMAIDAIRRIVDDSKDADDFLARLHRVTTSTQDRSLAPLRFERARILAMAQFSERWRLLLGDVQQHLTDDLTECFAQAQAKGWLNTDFAPRTGAVFIQAYTLGRLVDDITNTTMDDADWNSLIGLIARRTLSVIN
jgi:AcrR family transcriptional regulator